MRGKPVFALESEQAVQGYRHVLLRGGETAACDARKTGCTLQVLTQIGSGDFLSVLDAERSQLSVSAQLAQSETQLLLNLVAVYRALGGGWER